MADIRREKKAERETIAFSGDLTVPHANTIVLALREALQDAAAVDIVIENVTAVDVTFLQTLCAAHRTAAAQGKEVTVRGEGREPLGSLLIAAGFPRQSGCQSNTRKSCLWRVA